MGLDGGRELQHLRGLIIELEKILCNLVWLLVRMI